MFLIIFGLMLASAERGCRLGLRLHAGNEDARKGQIGGYGAGANGARSKLGSLFLPLLITVVIVLIFDISQPRVGLIQVGQQPLVDLKQSIEADQQIER